MIINCLTFVCPAKKFKKTTNKKNLQLTKQNNIFSELKVRRSISLLDIPPLPHRAAARALMSHDKPNPTRLFLFLSFKVDPDDLKMIYNFYNTQKTSKHGRKKYSRKVKIIK